MQTAIEPARIRQELLSVNLTTTDIARAAGVSRQAVDAVVRGKTTNPRIRRILAAQVNATYDALWGEPDPALVADPRWLRIQRLQRACGVTQRDMAKHCGTSVDTLRAVVQCVKSNPPVRRKIAELFGLSYDDLWGEPDPAVAEGVDPVAVEGKAAGIAW